jgi:GNAT superfamily N-acetyltransferase
MEYDIRPARQEDLDAATQIVREAIIDLRLRHRVNLAMPPLPILFQTYCLAADPRGLWVAENDSGIAGFAFSWTRETFWFLAQLFVSANAQGKGLGQALLAKALEQSDELRQSNRALITFAYNPQSTGLYIKNGLYPRQPLYSMSASTARVSSRLRGTAYDIRSFSSIADSSDWLSQIDEAALGFNRMTHHEFLLASGTVRAVLIEKSGRPVGYAYLTDQGHIGPVASAPGADPAEVVRAAIHCSLESHPEQISLVVPGAAERVQHAVSELGFRIDEPYVLMSAKPFGNWQLYLPKDPGYL